jgi:peptidoglycan/LPS O-acetylase OafA/YrhL
MPALAALLIITSAVGYFILTTHELREYGQSLFATSIFAANIYFWQIAGYFDSASETKPLLHMWSLGVEEQFYIFFPVVLSLMWRAPARVRNALVIAIALLSFIWSCYQVQTAPTSAFYSPIGRAWEFLIGSMLAMGMVPHVRSALTREIIGIAALATIIFATFTYTSAMPFPGPTAALPVLGTASLIHVGRDANLASRLLENTVLVWFGWISYSLYLWHWPVMAYMRYLSYGEMTPVMSIVAIAASIALGTLSWKYVENPFRSSKFSDPKKVFAVAGAVFLPLCAFALVMHGTQGLPGRYSPEMLGIANGGRDINPRRNECLQRSGSNIAEGRGCDFGVAGQPFTFAVIGDSFADAMMTGIAEAAEKDGLRGRIFMREGCFALLEVNQENPKCREFIRRAAREAMAMPDVETVVLVSRWASAAESSRVGVNTWSRFITDDQSKVESATEAHRVFAAGLERMINALPDKRIIIVYGTPEQEYIVSREATLDARFHRTTHWEVTKAAYETRQAFLRNVMRSAMASHPNVMAIDTGSEWCTSGICVGVLDKKALYADDNHVTRYGASLAVPALSAALAGEVY